MSQLVNRKVVLKSHPQGALKESDFEIVNDEVGEVTAGSVLVRVDVSLLTLLFAPRSTVEVSTRRHNLVG